MNKILDEMYDRFEMGDLKDPSKMSIRYLYKVLFSKFPNDMKKVTKIWEQIKEVKIILSSPKFKNYYFISKFIEVITHYKNINFGYILRASKEKKYFEGIKIFREHSIDYLYVSCFFEALPHINEFIKFHLLLYPNQIKADEEFQKFITYPEIYNKIFVKVEDEKMLKKTIKI